MISKTNKITKTVKKDIIDKMALERTGELRKLDHSTEDLPINHSNEIPVSDPENIKKFHLKGFTFGGAKGIAGFFGYPAISGALTLATREQWSNLPYSVRLGLPIGIATAGFGINYLVKKKALKERGFNSDWKATGIYGITKNVKTAVIGGVAGDVITGVIANWSNWGYLALDTRSLLLNYSWATVFGAVDTVTVNEILARKFDQKFLAAIKEKIPEKVKEGIATKGVIFQRNLALAAAKVSSAMPL